MLKVVDFHHHAFSPEYIAEMKKHGIEGSAGFGIPLFHPEKNIKVMDKLGIGKANLSISVPGVYVGDDRTSAGIARIANLGLNQYRNTWPERYGALAALPFPAKNESVAELEYAMDELGFDGVGVLTSADGHYFGEKGHDDLFREMDRRHTVVFIHPEDVRVPKGIHLGHGPFFERVLETTRVACNLLINGYLEGYPNIRYIFSHGGGAIPVMAMRIVTESFRTEGKKPDSDMFEYRLNLLRRNFFDTAQRGDSILSSLKSFCGNRQIVFGSDYPFTKPFEIALGIKELKASDNFSESELLQTASGCHVAGKSWIQEED